MMLSLQDVLIFKELISDHDYDYDLLPCTYLYTNGDEDLFVL